MRVSARWFALNIAWQSGNTNTNRGEDIGSHENRQNRIVAAEAFGRFWDCSLRNRRCRCELRLGERGMQLRNQFAHGLLDTDEIHEGFVLWLIHTLLVIGAWKKPA